MFNLQQNCKVDVHRVWILSVWEEIMILHSSFEHGSLQAEFPVVVKLQMTIDMMKTDTLPASLFLCIKKPI